MDPLLQQRKRPRLSATGTALHAKEKKKPLFKFLGSGFKHNKTVALGLLPGIVSLLLFGKTPALTVLFCTLLIVYLLDLFDKPHAIFLAVWAGMGAMNMLMFSQSIALVQISYVNIFITGLFSLSVLLIACWCSLQFAWIQQSSRGAMTVLERVLFNLSPLVFPVVMTYAITSFVSILHGPFIILASLCYVQHFLTAPLSSCFRTSETQAICNRNEMMVHTISLFALPVLFHIGLFHRNFFIPYHLVNLLAVISFAVLYFEFSGRSVLLRELGYRDTEKVSTAASIFALFVLVFCFEYRVIFVSFYYSIPLPAPFNYIFITIGCYTAASLAYLFILGDARRIGRLPCSIIACVGALTGGFALGMDISGVSVLVLAAFFLVSFYFSRKALNYLIFTVLASLLAFWFVLRSYWFLQFDFNGFDLQFVSLFIVVLTVFALCVPATVFASQRGMIMALYAFAIMLMENIIYFHPLGIYPFIMVLYTSVIGIALSYHLEKNKFMNRISSWLCYSIYSSKLIVLIAMYRESAFGSLLLVLSVLAPYYCHSRSLSKRVGLFYSIFYAFISFGATVTVGGGLLQTFFDTVPPLGMLAGVFFAIWGTLCFTLSVVFFPDSSVARQSSSTLTLLGMILLVVDPEFGLFVSIGSGTPLLFVFGLLFTLLCSQSRYPGVRAFYIIAMSVVCSVLLVDTTLPSSLLFYGIFSFIFLPFFIILNWLNFPSTWSVKSLPFVYFAFLLMFLIAVGSSSVTTSSYPPRVQGEYMKQIRSSLIGLYGGLSILLSLIMKMKLSKSSTTSSSTPFDMQWISEINNISTTLAYGVSCYFCFYTLGHSEFSLFLLAPILLLLTKDSFLCSWLRDDNRYAPVIILPTLILSSMSIYTMLYMALVRWKWRTLLVREFVAIVSVFPANYLFARFLVTQRKQPILWWFIVTPISLIGLFATFSSTFWLAIAGVTLSVGYFIIHFSHVLFQRDNQL